MAWRAHLGTFHTPGARRQHLRTFKTLANNSKNAPRPDEPHQGSQGCKIAKSIENSQKLTRIHQESPETIQEAPEMLCELVEQLFMPFGEHLLSHKQRARPRARSTIRSWKPQRLKHHRLAHTHSFASHARAKRNDFPVDSPLNPRSIEKLPKAHQDAQGVSRNHQGSTRDAL